jgi:hypothetical protein
MLLLARKHLHVMFRHPTPQIYTSACACAVKTEVNGQTKSDWDPAKQYAALPSHAPASSNMLRA